MLVDRLSYLIKMTNDWSEVLNARVLESKVRHLDYSATNHDSLEEPIFAGFCPKMERFRTLAERNFILPVLKCRR